MSRFLFVSLMLAGVAVVGCRRQESADVVTPADVPSAPVAAEDGVTDMEEGLSWEKLAAREPNEALATVNSHVYTVGEALRDVDERLKAMFGELSEADMAQRRPMLLNRIVDQFLMRSLLLDEADRLNVTISQAEQDEAFEKIRETLPPDTTLEEVMRKSPMGEERMKEEVLVGVRINKMLESILKESQDVTDEEIEAFQAENPSVTLPESVAAHHILIKSEESDTPEQKLEKRAKAEALHKQLQEGANFEELAKANSDCPSAQRGGDLGVFRRGQMVKPFEDAAFAQEIGAIGEVVETPFGYHIIRVGKHDQAGPPPKDQVRQMLTNRKSREAYEVFIEDLRAKAKIDVKP